MSWRRRRLLATGTIVIAVATALTGHPRGGQAAACSATIQPAYAGAYTCNDLGSVPGLPANYGGLAFLPSDANKLIIGGAANTASGKIYSISVTRDGSGHVTGFSGSASLFADAAYNDGGVVFGPGGVLFLARWPVNGLGETKPGSAITDKIVDMTPLGVSSSLSALNFVPTGFPGAGTMKLVTYGSGTWYDAMFAPDGIGTYDVTSATLATTLPGGPEGFTYVPPGSPVFASNSMLLSEYSAGKVVTYTLDSNGDPSLASRGEFITGLTGAEGAVIDPVTGDFLFSTFGGGSRVITIQGFTAPATSTSSPTATNTATPTNTATATGTARANNTATPTATNTPTPTTAPSTGGGVTIPVRTATPVPTQTQSLSPSATAGASTPRPVSTVLSAALGSRSGPVAAPNTGSGPGGGSDFMVLVLAAAAVLAAGAVAMAWGLRRR